LQVNREFFDQAWAGGGLLDPCASRLVEHVAFGHNAVVLTKAGEERAHHNRVYGASGFVNGYLFPGAELLSDSEAGACFALSAGA
jgi:hypothetical protein